MNPLLLGMLGVVGLGAWAAFRNPRASLGWIDRDASGRPRLDDREREEWINNDEGLYNWMRPERRLGGGMRGFIKRNRAEIDAAILRALDRPPAR